MGMIVSIINITDGPESKKTPTRLAIYTAHLDPGEELKLPASMIDTRIKNLEKQGYIVIGQLPSWYEASKSNKLGRKVLTQKELEARLVTKKSVKSAPVKSASSTRIPLAELATEEKKPTDKK